MRQMRVLVPGSPETEARFNSVLFGRSFDALLDGQPVRIIGGNPHVGGVLVRQDGIGHQIWRSLDEIQTAQREELDLAMRKAAETIQT